jgi:hypothetical protein
VQFFNFESTDHSLVGTGFSGEREGESGDAVGAESCGLVKHLNVGSEALASQIKTSCVTECEGSKKDPTARGDSEQKDGINAMHSPFTQTESNFLKPGVLVEEMDAAAFVGDSSEEESDACSANILRNYTEPAEGSSPQAGDKSRKDTNAVQDDVPEYAGQVVADFGIERHEQNAAPEMGQSSGLVQAVHDQPIKEDFKVEIGAEEENQNLAEKSIPTFRHEDMPLDLMTVRFKFTGDQEDVRMKLHRQICVGEVFIFSSSVPTTSSPIICQYHSAYFLVRSSKLICSDYTLHAGKADGKSTLAGETRRFVYHADHGRKSS